MGSMGSKGKAPKACPPGCNYYKRIDPHES